LIDARSPEIAGYPAFSKTDRRIRLRRLIDLPPCDQRNWQCGELRWRADRLAGRVGSETLPGGRCIAIVDEAGRMVLACVTSCSTRMVPTTLPAT